MSENDDPLDGVFQEIPEQPLTPISKQFQPWHKPRKHYIRIHQWCAAVRWLMKHNALTAGDTLHYLGFPGDDFLDVRSLQGVCQPADLKLRYLGFDSTATFAPGEAAFDLATHEVFQLGFVSERSRVVRARLEQLAEIKSHSYHQTKEFSHFDVINIDLCDSVEKSTNGKALYFEAVRQLCEFQTKARAKTWLLFLTSRVDREDFEATTRAKLLSCIQKNASESAQFLEELEAKLAVKNAALDSEIKSTAVWSQAVLTRALALAVGKWLLGMLGASTPPVSVVLQSSIVYRVHNVEPDMVSLVFQIEPHTALKVDSSGLTGSGNLSEKLPSEPELGLRLVDAVTKSVDIDEKLKADGALLEKVIGQCATLLATVRYDEEAYKAWARTGQ